MPRRSLTHCFTDIYEIGFIGEKCTGWQVGEPTYANE